MTPAESGDNPATIRALLTQAAHGLDTDSATLDAEVLLGFVLQQPRSHLYAWPDKALTPAQHKQFQALLRRRHNGEPVAYLTGEREFWSLSLNVTPATLIPRPETELLVSLALQHLPPGRPCRVADLGTGSGAIACALAHERPQAQLVATDLFTDALTVAAANARRLGIGNIDFRAGHWCEPLDDPHFDLILSNPPYIAAADPHLALGDVRFEPRTALAAGAQGMDDLRQIARCARAHLMPGGYLLLEHGFDQGKLATQLLEISGFSDITDHADTEGHARVIAGRLSA